jgi:hypothetical protein
MTPNPSTVPWTSISSAWTWSVPRLSVDPAAAHRGAVMSGAATAVASWAVATRSVMPAGTTSLLNRCDPHSARSVVSVRSG